jgi:hypothetical protein
VPGVSENEHTLLAPAVAFRVLDGLPTFGPPPEQFTYASKHTNGAGLVLEVESNGGRPWVGNFQLGRTSYSTVLAHPDGQNVVIIAGGVGYILRPGDRQLIATFGGGISGAWPVPALSLLLFNDSGLAFRALGPEGPRWGTPRISWDGFEGIEIAEKTIYGRAWNAPLQCWQPFTIEIATGIVRGAAYSESSQQRIALGRELALQGTRLHPVAKRIIESAIGLLAISLAVLTVYLAVDSARTGDLTWAKIWSNWGIAYAAVFITVVVLILGVRLVFPSLAPEGRLLSRSGINAFIGIYLAMLAIVYFTTGVVPLVVIAIAIGWLGPGAIRKWFS